MCFFKGTHSVIVLIDCHMLWQGAAICTKYMEEWPLPTVRDFGYVGVLCTFDNIPAAAAAGIVRSSQLSNPLPGQAVRYIMAGRPAFVTVQPIK